MITIDQLLESVDLDFEPRFVTKDEDGQITIFSHRPIPEDWCEEWREGEGDYETFGVLKLAEFENKYWTECLYEVPRKEEPKDKIKIGTLYIDKGVTFGDGDDDDVGFVEDYEVPRKTTGNEIEQKMLAELERKLNAIVDAAIDAVNELKGAKNE